MADVVVFRVDSREYTASRALLAKQSSAPLATWLDDLLNSSRHGVTRAEIEPFLAAVEGRNSWRLNGMSDINLDERRAVLRLATRWHFEDLRNLAIDNLEKLVVPVEKLVLARVYCIRWWLVPAYTELALRLEPLSVIEARQLDAEDVVRIFSARENVLRQRLSPDEHTLTTHFTEVVLGDVSANRHEPPQVTQLSAAPPLSSCQHNDAIIVSGSVPVSSVPDRSLVDVTLPSVDISPFIAGDCDAGVALITAANAHEVAKQLCNAPEILSGGARKRTRYIQRGVNLVLAALRRSVRQENFVRAGGQFAGAILDFMRRGATEYATAFAGSFQSLDALWRQFQRSGIVPRQDSGKIMPTDLTPDAYRACVKNGQAFIAALADQGFVRGWKSLNNTRALLPRGRQSSISLSPAVQPVGAESSRAAVAPSHSYVAPARTSLHQSAAMRFKQSRLHRTQPSINDIVNDLKSPECPYAGMAWITSDNVNDVFQSFRACVDGRALLDGSRVDLLCALFCRACDDRDFHVAGIKFLIALCEAYPIVVAQVSVPIDWIIESWLELLQRPDMTPSPDRGRIVRRWQSPGMVPKLYKERIGNVRAFILEALNRQPLSKASWASRVRESFSY